MKPEEISKAVEEINCGVQEIKGGVESNKNELEAQGNRLKTIEEAIAAGKAEHERRFLEFRKQLLAMPRAQRSRRGLGNDELNSGFGKALVKLARHEGPDGEVLTTKAAGITDTYLVGVEYSGEIIRLVEELGVARRISRHVPMGEGTVNWPRRTGGVTAAHIAKASAVTASNPTAGQVQLVADTIMALSLVQNASLEDEVASLGAWVAEEIAYGMAGIEDTDFVSGDGTATYGSVWGILSAFTDLTNKPSVVTMDAGNTSFEDLTFDDLMTMIENVKSQALRGSRWLLHRSILTILRQIKDSQNRYIWEPSGAVGNPATILGYPYELCDKMPARTSSAVSTKFLAFGNFDYWFFGDRRQLAVAADTSKYREYDQTGFFGTERVAQAIADGGAIAVLSTPAA